MVPAKNTIAYGTIGDAEDAARFYAKTFPDRPSPRSIVRRRLSIGEKQVTC